MTKKNKTLTLKRKGRAVSLANLEVLNCLTYRNRKAIIIMNIATNECSEKGDTTKPGPT